MKKKKKTKINLVFPSICLVLGGLITIGTTFYISYYFKPKNNVIEIKETAKYTIIDLNYHFDYDNTLDSNKEESMIQNEVLHTTIENKNTITKENKKSSTNKNIKKEEKTIINNTTENTNITNENIVQNANIEETINEAKKEPILEFTAILEKDVPENGFNKVLEKYTMTEDELYTIIAIVGTEGGGSNYIEAYAIINVIYNRTQSKRWSSYVTSLGNDGNTLYGQATAKGQFSVYQKGTYKGSLGNTTTKAYAAVINFLLDENIMHDYLSFRPASANVEGVMYNQKGNKYLNELSISDKK